MIYVDKTGRRVTNEKLAYNELAQAFFDWDPAKVEYPEPGAGRDLGPAQPEQLGQRRVRPLHRAEGHRRRAMSSRARRSTSSPRRSASALKQYASRTGDLKLADDFADNLAGDDRALQRLRRRRARTTTSTAASAQVELLFNGAVREEPGRTNPTMYPISDEGPYYAALLTGGNLDTKGGPATNPDGQVLDDPGEPIPGLYGVGNCVASASARAYWAGGATLGPIMAFAYLAASRERHAARQPTASATRLRRKHAWH